MKKLLILAVFILSGLVAYGQISPDSAYTTTADDLLEVVGSGLIGGDSKKDAYLKINAIIDTLHTFFVVDTMGLGAAPDSAAVDAALGISPADATGKRWYIKDTGGTGAIYFVVSDGTDWYIDSLSVL